MRSQEHCVCVRVRVRENRHPEELLGVFDEEGHAAVQFVQVVFQVHRIHLQQDKRHNGQVQEHTDMSLRSTCGHRRVPEEHLHQSQPSPAPLRVDSRVWARGRAGRT